MGKERVKERVNERVNEEGDRGEGSVRWIVGCEGPSLGEVLGLDAVIFCCFKAVK